jgi:hypothetical protein
MAATSSPWLSVFGAVNDAAVVASGENVRWRGGLLLSPAEGERDRSQHPRRRELATLHALGAHWRQRCHSAEAGHN